MDSAAPASSAAVLPRADARLVALGIGEDPERPGAGRTHERSAGRDRRRHPLLGNVVGDRDIEVDAIALGARLVHLLEPERRPDPVRVDDGVDLPPWRARWLFDVTQHGLPERTDGVDVQRVDRHLHT